MYIDYAYFDCPIKFGYDTLFEDPLPFRPIYYQKVVVLLVR